MADLIERKAAIDALNQIQYWNPEDRYRAVKALQELRVTDADPVQHGQWMYGSDGFGDEHYYCSLCLRDALEKDGEWELSKRCPNCGAHMDEEATNGE